MNWETIEPNLDAWADVLKQLQEKAGAAMQAGDESAKADAIQDLEDFIDHSPYHIDGIDKLDEVASDTIIDMYSTDIQAALGRIKGRTAVINALTKRIKKVNAQANAAAKSILLENMTTLIGQLTQVVSQANTIRTKLEQNEASEVATELGKLLETAAELLPTLERLEEQ